MLIYCTFSVIIRCDIGSIGINWLRSSRIVESGEELCARSNLASCDFVMVYYSLLTGSKSFYDIGLWLLFEIDEESKPASA